MIDILLFLLTVLLILSSGLSVMFAALVFERGTDTLWARPFGWLASMTALFTVAYALELNSTGLNNKLHWGYTQYFSTSLIPVFYFLFALGYSEHPWAGSRYLGLLFIIPALTLFFLWFDINDLVYTTAVLVPSYLGPNVNADYGWWFWIHITHSYLLLAGGAIALIQKARRLHHGLPRTQIAILILVVGLPVLGNIMTVTDLVEIDLTPLLAGLMTLVMVFTIFRLHLFDIDPTRIAVVERMEDGFVSLDPENHIIDFNQATQRILGKASWELRNEDLSSLALLDEKVREKLKDGSYAGRLESSIENRDGIRHYALYVSHLLKSNKTDLGRLVLLRDITERRQLEQIQEDLMRAMVHDLRSPISTVIQYLDLLHDEWRAGDITYEWGAETLTRVNNILRSSIQLIERTLELQRMENGQLDLQFEELALNDLLDYIEPMVRPTTQRKQVRLLMDLEPALPPVLVDRMAIARVLQNLIDNGLKFSPSGGEIVLKASAERDNGHPQLLVSLSDNGPGISDELRPQLFQKFARGDHAERGFGLGLAFCKTIIEAHGEKIWLDTSSTTGTTISFTLPVAFNHRQPESRPVRIDGPFV